MDKNKKSKDSFPEKTWYDAQAIVADADPESVIAMMGLEYRVKGDDISFLCPFHPDRHIGSCSMSREKKLFHCFSCGASGSITSLVKKHLNYSFPETLEFIMQASGLNPASYTRSGGEPEKLKRRRDFVRENGKQLERIGLISRPKTVDIPIGMVLTKAEAEEKRKAGFAIEKNAVERNGRIEESWVILKRVRTPGLEELAEKDPETYGWLVKNKKREFTEKVTGARDAVIRIVDDIPTCAMLDMVLEEKLIEAGCY